MLSAQVIFTLWAVSTFPQCGVSFELQDTIHALIEENIHLHDQLENLTQALRELKQLLWNHSKEAGGQHDPELQHLWDEWMEHGVNAETHLLLEHVFCGHDLHGMASSLKANTILILITLLYFSFLLL